jgi:hypothetical protein
MRVLVLTLAMVFMVLSFVHVFAQDASDASIPIEISSEYLGVDAKPVLENCEFLHWDDPACHSHFEQSFLIKSHLTTNEEYMIGTFLVDEGKEMGASPSIRRAIEYAERTGDLPFDGIELLNLYDSFYLTEEGFAEWQAADERSRLAMIRRAINPATGEVYATFQAEVWVPFGINITKLEGEDSVQVFPLGGTDSNGESFTEMRAYQGWQITVYGEEPGSILIDKPIWREIKSQGPLKTGCGCRPKDTDSAESEEQA